MEKERKNVKNRGAKGVDVEAGRWCAASESVAPNDDRNRKERIAYDAMQSARAVFLRGFSHLLIGKCR